MNYAIVNLCTRNYGEINTLIYINIIREEWVLRIHKIMGNIVNLLIHQWVQGVMFFEINALYQINMSFIT